MQHPDNPSSQKCLSGAATPCALAAIQVAEANYRSSAEGSCVDDNIATSGCSAEGAASGVASGAADGTSDDTSNDTPNNTFNHNFNYPDYPNGGIAAGGAAYGERNKLDSEFLRGQPRALFMDGEGAAEMPGAKYKNQSDTHHIFSHNFDFGPVQRSDIAAVRGKARDFHNSCFLYETLNRRVNRLTEECENMKTAARLAGYVLLGAFVLGYTSLSGIYMLTGIYSNLHR